MRLVQLVILSGCLFFSYLYAEPFLIGKTSLSLDKQNISEVHQDLLSLKNLGANSYKFLIDWQKIEPIEGEFSLEAIKSYEEILERLEELEIVPFVVLYDRYSPKWFEEKGGFAAKENISFFKRFCRYIFSRFCHKNILWILFEQPSFNLFEKHVQGSLPPYESSFAKGALLLENTLSAHCSIYHSLKKIAPSAQIGISQNYRPFLAYHSWNYIEQAACYFFSQFICDSVVNFFSSNFFYFSIPTYVRRIYYHPKASTSFDFVALNYYSRPLLKLQLSFEEPLKYTCKSDEVMIDPYNRVDPEGLLEGVQYLSQLNKPLYITDNACVEDNGEQRREYLEKSVEILTKAQKEGYMIQGYLHSAFSSR